MTAYRIRDWEKHFENNRTRELKKLSWVPFPNKHDGDGYTELITHRNGAAHYGVWCALVQVASKCDPRGTLLRDGKTPHTATSLARKTRLRAELIEATLQRLISIGWIEVYDVLASGCEIPALPCGLPEGKGREQNRREKKIRKIAQSESKDQDSTSPPTVPPELQGLELYEADSKLCKALPENLLAWKKAFPGVDIVAEIRKAHAWEVANPERRKVQRIRFLTRWLTKAQDGGGRSGNVQAKVTRVFESAKDGRQYDHL